MLHFRCWGNSMLCVTPGGRERQRKEACAWHLPVSFSLADSLAYPFAVITLAVNTTISWVLWVLIVNHWMWWQWWDSIKQPWLTEMWLQHYSRKRKKKWWKVTKSWGLSGYEVTYSVKQQLRCHLLWKVTVKANHRRVASLHLLAALSCAGYREERVALLMALVFVFSSKWKEKGPK